ncbi:CHY zinc finger domain-containing protein [Sodiomyces alkalinus F11]|uniref:CHY zinc finger domain-containing protein n=1 Tax=Sodiomyces alkalinus (strain CBS 110278 / VKM F-3762 / F11) TaxID=1314773 RepID=A0A3N2PNZ2_SODAK|nr:CHY zinc finger domain-containing protein [Sodiomyces alkalinus F11]ROT36235.1 CHY zinc finger domain-containing protein [Sodiomyces alkalinus F11]
MVSLQQHGGVSRQQAVSQPSSQRVVPKPVPEAQSKDPRGYQLEQLRRRYLCQETTLKDGATSLAFRLKPSDPDFPFDLDLLECELRVPEHYPEEPPTLRVRNKDIPRGFAINVEKGWEKLVREKPGATLLALTHALDRNLEVFLSEQKAETIKLVAFKDTRHHDAVEHSVSQAAAMKQASPSALSSVQPPSKPQRYLEPSYSQEQIAEAKARRAQETRQIETRMGRLSLYRRSADGIVYTLPVEPRRRFELPAGLQGVKTMHFIVPLLYPLQPLRIQLNEVESLDAEPLEELFVQKAIEQKQMTLMSHVNYFAQNMHVLAKQAQAQPKQPEEPREPGPKSKPAAPSVPQKAVVSDGLDDERSHIKVIPRPPEWARRAGDPEDEEDSSDYSYDSSSDDGSDTDGAPLTADPGDSVLPSGSTRERGIALSFPGIELHAIELLRVSILSISVKCERCKTVNEITGLKDETEKMASCRKCAAGFAARFRSELVHQNSARAGFLDLAGATVADMLPSTFVPVCAKCSTPSPGLVSVRGESTTNVCRDCHGKFNFKIPDVRFLPYAPGTLTAPASGNPGKQDKLGLRTGEPLPSRGACGHYRKSFRWFRFSCCNRVYPCDRCHDEAEEHLNEWASRMVCGWCSREQRYAVDSCGFCGRSVIGRRGKGFWEGGKGTRDRRLMNRKDKRKHKRVGPGEAARKD